MLDHGIADAFEMVVEPAYHRRILEVPALAANVVLQEVMHGASLEGSAIGILARDLRAGEALVAPPKIADHRGGRIEGWHEQTGAAERDATGYQPLAQARQYRTEIVAVATLLQNPVDELDHAGSGSDLSAQLSRRLFQFAERIAAIVASVAAVRGTESHLAAPGQAQVHADACGN